MKMAGLARPFCFGRLNAPELGALEARLGAGTGMRLEQQDRFLHLRIQSAAAGIDIGEDRLAHPRIPELLDMAGNSRNDFVLLLILEELADLVRHVDETVRRHRAATPRRSAARCAARLSTIPRIPPATRSAHSTD